MLLSPMYYYGDEVEEVTRTAHKKSIKILVGKCERKKPLGRPRCR
jgi:hypothetical protein